MPCPFQFKMYLFIYIFSLCVLCSGFNLETRLPVIKKGAEGSYFGFSVAEHQSFNESRGQIEQSWLLVGAPLDENKQPLTNRSGALWSCPITTRFDDCIQVVTDGKRTVDDDVLMPPLNDEIKDGQWMGVTVRSQGVGGKVMVCAHRYIRSGEDYRFGGGLCYTLTQRLEYDGAWEPCKGRPTNRGHEQYGYCQAGTSGMLVNDTALIGTPGPYNWRGTVFVFSVSDDYLDRDLTMYYSPLTEESAPVDHYSYLGMSVVGGELLSKDLYVAAGAPRSNGTGQVVIFKKVRPTIIFMDTVKILSGEQITSNFGYEMAIADVNGDKYPDLLVGAPNYFSKDEGGAVYIFVNKEYCLDCQKPIKLTGKPESRFGIAITKIGDLNKDGYDDIAIGAPYEDSGVVYVYLGSSNGVVQEPSQVIRGKEFGPKLITFGYSLSGGLDLDSNGYPDLLIGAFESATVVMLRARPIVDLTTTVGPPSQLANIDPSVKGCRHHPDANLTCFSFEACVWVKSVGQGRLGGSIRLRYKLEADVNRKIPRVSFDQNGARHQTLEKDISLARDSVTGEFKHCHNHTAYIKEGTRDIQSAISLRLNYRLVQEEPAKVRPGEQLPPVDSLPILNQQQAAKLFDATFLKDCGDNDICESKLLVRAEFNLPRSDPGGWELVLGEHTEVMVNATVQNLRESAYEATLNIYHPPTLAYIGYVKQIETGHSCETANTTLVVCSIGNPLTRNASSRIAVRFDPKDLDEAAMSRLELVVVANTTSTMIDPQDPLTLRAEIVNKADLTLSGQGKPEQVIYGGAVKGESAMRYSDDIGSRVVHTYQIVNSGLWRVKNVEVEVDWPHQVANNKPLGKWLLYMDVMPYVDALGGGECKVDPRYINPLGLKGRPPPSNMIAPVADRYSNGTVRFVSTMPTGGYKDGEARIHSLQRRRRREIEMVVKTTNYTEPGSNRVIPIISLNCETETAKCFKFRCIIYNLDKNKEATIFIKSRLWNVTLVEDYSLVSQVWISSRGRIVLPPNVNIQQDSFDDIARVKLVALRGGRGEAAEEGAPLWLIVLAVLVGLLILLFVMWCLFKCGFFKRRRPHQDDPTLSAEAILDKSSTKPDDFDY